MEELKKELLLLHQKITNWNQFAAYELNGEHAQFQEEVMYDYFLENGKYANCSKDYIEKDREKLYNLKKLYNKKLHIYKTARLQK